MVVSELHKLVKQPETPPVVISVQTEETDLQKHFIDVNQFCRWDRWKNRNR